ncbi:MAG: ABC transporter permease [Chloroflexota bacterium]|nr:ABC transporter permease [Chloroflexota bacterium]
MVVRWSVLWSLFVAALKMFVRNRVALFFSLFVPILIMVIFGVLNLGGPANVSLGLVDEASSPAAVQLGSVLERFPAFDVERGNRVDELERLEGGHLDMVLVIPAGFEGATGPALVAYRSAARPQEGLIGELLLQRGLSQALTGAGGPPQIPLRVETVNARHLGYIDFLVPGVVGMTIMNLGLFAVAFGFVRYKRTGMLRRLFATPTPPAYFLVAQIASRLVIGLAQVVVLLAVGVLVFKLTLVGGIATLLAIATIGSLIFLAIGFAIAGWAKNEDQAAPVANLISLPMLFLSGVFFPREAMPEILHAVTGFMPLTYLNDALRMVANDGASLADVGPQLLGMGVWMVISFAIAVRLFRWE